MNFVASFYMNLTDSYKTLAQSPRSLLLQMLATFKKIKRSVADIWLLLPLSASQAAE